MIPTKNQFSKANDWEEPEEEVYRVLSKQEMLALQQSSLSKHQPLSPWKIILVQIATAVLCTMVWSIFGAEKWLSLYTLSAFLGGLICVLPAALFLIRVELAKKSQRLNPGRFLAALVSGEFIKISMTLMLFIGVAVYIPDAMWVPLLVTYVLVLKSAWLAAFWR